MTRRLAAGLALAAAGFFCMIPPAAAVGPVPPWGRWEGEWKSRAAGEETNFRLEIRSPSGRRRRLDGFWDGGRTFKARVMPDEEGLWEWKTTSDPPDPGLHNKSGTFECRRGAGAPVGARFLDHGAVSISGTRRYLAHADGAPFFWLADTAWSGALLARAKDWSMYLRDRARRKFSAVQIVTTQFRAAEGDEEGRTAFTGVERISINPAFFQRLDRRMDDINRHNLLAVPVLLWAIRSGENAKLNPGFILPDDQAIRLARYMVARYGAHHVVWILAGDDNYQGANGERWSRIGRAVFDDPAVQAPAMLHPGGMQWHLEQYRGEPWNQIFGYQSGHGDDAAALKWIHSGPPALEWKREPARPVINLEPPYEGHIAYQSRRPHSDFNVRRAVYWSLLNAPTAGVTYGSHGVWSWQNEAGVPLAHRNAGEAPRWQDALDRPGTRQMTVMAGIFQRIPWWELQPRPDLLAEQPGLADPAAFISVSSDTHENTLIAYTPAGSPILFKPALSLSRHEAQWIDPRSGRGMKAAVEGGRFRPPDSGDWLLLLRR